MNLRDNMNQLFKTFANEHDENFHNTKATLIQLERETTLREEKLVMNECMTALIELQQQFRRTLQAERKYLPGTLWERSPTLNTSSSCTF